MYKNGYDYVAELFKLACQYNSGDFHVYCSLSGGYVGRIELQIYCGKKGDRDPDNKSTFYFNLENSYLEYETRKAIVDLTRLHRLYRKHGITSLGNWG